MWISTTVVDVKYYDTKGIFNCFETTFYNIVPKVWKDGMKIVYLENSTKSGPTQSDSSLPSAQSSTPSHSWASVPHTSSPLVSTHWNSHWKKNSPSTIDFSFLFDVYLLVSLFNEKNWWKIPITRKSSSKHYKFFSVIVKDRWWWLRALPYNLSLSLEILLRSRHLFYGAEQKLKSINASICYKV